MKSFIKWDTIRSLELKISKQKIILKQKKEEIKKLK